MEKRLFLDRVTLHSGDVSPGNVERATVVEPNLADSGLSLGNRAAVTTGIATHSIAIQFFPQSGVVFADAVVGSQDVAQRGHESILRLFEASGLCPASSLPQGAQRTQGKPAQFASDFARWPWVWIHSSACWRAAATCAWVIWEAKPWSRDLLFSSPWASAIADQK